MTRPAKPLFTSSALASLSLSCALLLPLGCIDGSSETESTSTSASGSTSQVTAGETDNATSGKTTSGTTADLSGTDATTEATTGTSTDGTTGGTTGGTTEGTTGDWPGWCNYFDELCPEGTKCTFDGDIGTVQCIEIVRDPLQMGDACDPGEGGSFDGIDECDDNLICWENSPDGPICIPFCGYEDDFTCDAGMTCTTCQTCALGLCQPNCDPLGDECQEGDVCIPLSGGEPGFGCVLDASEDEGAYGDVCEYLNACDPGHFCASSDLLPACEGSGCCTPFCNLNEPECPENELICTSWFEPGQAPEPFKHIGVCIIPQ